MIKNQKIFLSGIKPTGRSHIGNYFGAMRQFLALEKEFNGLVMVADLHSLTSTEVQKNPEQLRKDIIEIATDYLAVGLNPEKTIIFRQSEVPYHAELAWIFDCLTTMPYLMRAHAFKDAEAKNKEINVGVFNYPMLMATDILLYDVDLVPVGQDQKQHLEITRDIATKFNNLYGDTFKIPEPVILEDVATVPGLDGQKMSKSYNNTIPLFAEDEEIKSLVMSIVTDSKEVDEPKDPEQDNVFALFKLFGSETECKELDKKYRAGGLSYKESKEMLVEKLQEFVRPLRERRKEFENNPEKVMEILERGSERAGEIAEIKMREIKRKVGLSLK